MDSLLLNSSWLFNFIPWQAWVVIALVVLGLTFQFWAPIWLALPTWAKTAIVFVIVAFTAYIAGRNRGSKDERDIQRRKEAGAVQQREKIDAEIKRLDDTALQKRLDRWTR